MSEIYKAYFDDVKIGHCVVNDITIEVSRPKVYVKDFYFNFDTCEIEFEYYTFWESLINLIDDYEYK